MTPSRVRSDHLLPPASEPHSLGAASIAPVLPTGAELAAQLAAKARAEGAGYIKKSADLGELSSKVFDAAGQLAAAYIDGGDAAMWSAITTGLSVGAGAVCAATPAAPVAPLCAVLGGVVGQALQSIFGSDPPKGPNVLETHNARFYAVFNPLLAQCPDDRAGGGAIYNKCSAQLAVVSHLFVDGVDWGPVDPYAGDGIDYGGGYGWSMIAYGADPAEWPMLTGPEAEWRWVCGTFSGAFGAMNEPLPEFQAGCCSTPGLLAPCQPKDTDAEALQARRTFWRFMVSNVYQGIPYYKDAESNAPGVPPPAFHVAVQRILTSARAETEWRFQRTVGDFARRIQEIYLPQCNNSPQCHAGIIKDSFEISFDALSTARGLALAAGTPQQIVDRGVAGLDVWIIAGESGFDKKVAKERDFKDRTKNRRAGDKAAQEAAEARKKRSAGVSAGQVVGGLLVFGAVALGGLALERQRRGLAPLPGTWKPKGWLK